MSDIEIKPLKSGRLAALRDAGYDGFVSLEPHELPHKDRWLIEESLRYIRSTGVA